MGSVNEILTDKTGAITESKMEVAKIFSEGKLHVNLNDL